MDTITAIEALDNGKTFHIAKGDVPLSANCIQYYSGWTDKIVGQMIDTNPGSLTYTRHEPVGVCGQIIPWNFPLLMWSWKIGPAIFTGNTGFLFRLSQCSRKWSKKNICLTVHTRNCCS
jgi:aldehyde dehydrogenase (NAD+)